MATEFPKENKPVNFRNSRQIQRLLIVAAALPCLPWQLRSSELTDPLLFTNEPSALTNPTTLPDTPINHLVACDCPACRMGANIDWQNILAASPDRGQVQLNGTPPIVASNGVFATPYKTGTDSRHRTARSLLIYAHDFTAPDIDTKISNGVTRRSYVESVARQQREWLAVNSGGKMDSTYEIIDGAINYKNIATQTKWGNPGEFISSALAAAGKNESDYDYIQLVWNDVPGDSAYVNWNTGAGGIGSIGNGYGTPSFWAQDYARLHELGHNLGFWHANSVRSVNPDNNTYSTSLYRYDFATKQYTTATPVRNNPSDPIAAGTIGLSRFDYGNPLDLMATWGGQYSTRDKQSAGWLKARHFAKLTAPADGNVSTITLHDATQLVAATNTTRTTAGLGGEIKYGVTAGYADTPYSASFVRKAQKFVANATNTGGSWVTYAQAIDLNYVQLNDAGTYGIELRVDNAYYGVLQLNQSIREKDIAQYNFIIFNSPWSTTVGPDLVNTLHADAPLNPDRYRSAWYDIAYTGNATDALGNYGTLRVTTHIGATLGGHQWDADPLTAGAQDGAGTWSAAGGNWRNVDTATDNLIWESSLDATFGAGTAGAGGTVTVAGTVVATSLMFKPVTAGGAYALNNGVIDLGAGGLNAEADVTIGSTLNFTAQQAWEIVSGKTVTLNGVITNAGNQTLYKLGLGDLVLNTANTWTGNLIVAEARVVQQANQTFSGTDLTLNESTSYEILAGTLSFSGGARINTALVGNDAVVRLNSTASTAAAPDILFSGGNHRADIFVGTGTHYLSGTSYNTIDGALTGSGTLAVNMASSSAQLVLNGTNTHDGQLRIERGIVSVTDSATLSGQNRLTFDVASGQSAQFRTGAADRTVRDLSSTGAGAVTIGNYGSTAATLTVNQGVSGAYAGLIVDGSTGALALKKTGTATLSLSAPNTYSGGTLLEQGTLRITGSSIGTGTLTMAGGKLTVDQSSGLSLTRIAGSTLNTTPVSGGSYTSDLSPLHLTAGNPISNSTYAYTGKIYLTAGNWAFGENFDDAVYLKINGTTILNNSDWGTTTYGGITIAATGWYDLDLRLQNSGSGGPMEGSGWDSIKGVGVRQGTVVTGGGNYTAFDIGALGIDLRDTLVLANAVRLDADATLEITNTSLATAETKLTGAITGTGALIKTGGGTLTLGGTAKTYTGATRINEGVLATADANVLSASSAVVLANTAGVALDLRGNNQTIGSLAGGGSLGGAVTLGSARLTTGADNTSTAYAGVISGTGGLTKTGAGTLTLSGQNTYTGETRVAGGALALDFSAANAPTSAIINAASALTLDNGRIEIIGKTGGILTQNFAGLTLAGDANTLRLNRNGAASLDVDIGAITRTGVATINFDGITGATLGARVITSTGTAGGLLDGGARWAMVNGADWAAKDVSNTYVVAYSGYTDITTNGGIIPTSPAANIRINEAGGGTVTLAGATTTAVTSVLMRADTTDTVVSMASRTLDTAAIAVGADAAKLTIGATPGQGVLTASDNSLTLLANNAAASRGITVNAVIANAAATPLDLTVSGGAVGGTVTLAGDNTYTGTTTAVGNAHLRVGAGGSSGTLGSGAVNLAAGSDITFHRTDSSSVSNAIHGAGNLIREGIGGTTILTGTSDYTGTTAVTSGTLQIGTGTTGAVTGTSGFTVDAGATLAFGRSDAATISAAISGNGNLTALGNGTTILTGANTYAGTTRIQSGTTLQVGAGGGSGTLGTGSVIADGTLAINRADTVTLANTVSGSGTLSQTGAGTALITGNNSHTETRIEAGTLQIGNGGTSGTLGTGAVTTNAALVFNRSDAITVANTISGTGTVSTRGAGTLTLTGANTYGGGTTVTAGAALRLTDTGTAGTGNVVDNGTLIIESSASRTVANLISGTGALISNGPGTLILTADNTHIGATTVNAGTLQLGNGGATGSIGKSVVTLASGTTLAINRTGAINAPVVGIISGAPGTGTVRLDGDNSTVLTLDTAGINRFSGNLIISAATQLVLNRTSDTDLSALINNSGTVTFEGNRSTTFKGLITGSGNTIINAGSVWIGTGGDLGTGALLINSGGKLGHDGSNYSTSTLNRAVTINGGEIANAGWFTRITLEGSLDIAAGGARFVTTSPAGSNGGGDITINSLVSGSGAITTGVTQADFGLGRLNFNNAANTYSGTITLTGLVSQNGGNQRQILGIGASTALRYATLNLAPIDAADTNRNQVNFASGITAATIGGLTGNAFGGLRLTNAGNGAVALTVDNASANAFGGIISGSGSLIKAGAGTLSLSGKNTYTGTTAVNAGTLALDFSAAGAPTNDILAATSTINLGGGTLRIIGTAGQNGVMQTFAGLTTAAGASRFELVQNGATSLDVNVGTLTFGAGTVDFVGLTGSAAGARVITTNSVGLNDGFSQLSGTSAFWNGTGWASVQEVAGIKYIVAWTGTNTDVFTGTATGGTTVIPSGSGTNIYLKEGGSIGGPNTLAAATTTIDSLLMQAGTTDATIRLNANSAADKLVVGVGAGGAGNLAITASGRSLTIGESVGQGILTSGTTGASSLSITSLSPTAKVRVNAVIADNVGAVSLIAGNGVELAADNTYTGTTTVTVGGTLRVGVGGTTGSLGSGAVTDNGTITFDRSDSITVANTISGTGVINQTGSGTLSLSGTNSHTGGTTASAGTLAFANGSLGTSGAVTMNGGTLRWATGNTQDISSRLTLVNAKAATLDTNGNTVSLASAFGGNTTASLVKTGAGTLTLSGTNTYSGGTTLNTGTLRADTAGSLGTGAVSVNTGTILRVGSISNSSYTLTNAITLNGGGTLWSYEPTSSGITLSGLITVTGTGNVIQSTFDNRPLILSGGLAGSGTVTLRQGNDAAGSTGYGWQGGIIRLTGDGTAFTGTAIIQNQAAGYPVSIEHNNALASATVQMGTNGRLRLSTDNATLGGLTGTTGTIYNADATTRTLTIGTTATNIYGGLLGDGTANGNAFALVKNGAGTLALGAINTYTGGTTINTGTLRADAPGSLGTGAVTVNTGAVLKVGAISGDSYTLGNAITLAGGATLWSEQPASTGITLTGLVTVSGTGNVIQSTFENRPLTLSGGLIGNGTVTFRQANDAAGTTGYANQGGVIRLTADSSGFTGTAVIQNQAAGSPVSIERNNALVNATVQMGTNGRLRLSTANASLAGLTGTAGTIYNADATARALTVNNTANTTYGGTLGDGTANGNTFSLVKSGAGTLALSGKNTYTGTTAVNTGTLALDFSAAGAPTTDILAATSTISLGGGTLRIIGTAGQNGVVQTFAGLTTAAGASRFELVQNGAISLDVNVGTLTFGAGTVDFVGLTGTTAGARVITANSAGANDGLTQISGTSAFWNGTGWASVQNVSGTKYLVAWNGSYTDVFTGTATGGSTVITSGTGTNIRLKEGGTTGGTNTLAAATTSIDSLLMQAETTDATIRLNANSATDKLVIGSGSGGTGNIAINTTGRSLTIGETVGQGILTSGTTGASSLSITSLSPTAKVRVNAVIADNVGAVSLIAGSGVELAANNTYTGTTTVTIGGTLRVGLGGTTGSLGSGAVTDNGTLAFDRSDNITVANTISGTGVINQTGSGTLSLTGTNSHTGGTTASGGTLVFTTGSIGTSGAVTLNGGTLRWATGNTQDISSRLTLVNAKAATLDTNGNTVNLASGFGGNTTASLVKTGAGTLILGAANTYSGGTILNTGTLRADAGGSLGTGAVTVNTGTVLRVGTVYNSSYTLTNAITLNGGGTLWSYEPSSSGITLSGLITITGTGNVIQTTWDNRPLTLSGGLSGSGTVTLRQGNDAAGTSGYDWQGGIIRLTADGTAFTGTAIVQSQAAGYPVSIEHTNALASATVQMGTNGRLRLSTANANLGGLTGTTGTVYNANATARTLTINNTANNTYGGTLGDGTANGNAFALAKTGNGTLSLNGNNTYTGGTTLSAGIIVAGHNSALGTGTITVSSTGTLNAGLAGSNRTLGNTIIVNSGGKLMGAAAFTGSVSINDGGTLAPGNSPGIESFSGGLSMATGSVYQWEFQGNSLATAGTDFDQIVITAGTMTIASGAYFKFTPDSVDYANSYWTSNHNFLVIDAQGPGLISGSFTKDTSAAGAFTTYGTWDLNFSGGDVYAVWTVAIPEPSSYGLAGTGLLAALAAIRRRRRKA